MVFFSWLCPKVKCYEVFGEVICKSTLGVNNHVGKTMLIYRETCHQNVVDTFPLQWKIPRHMMVFTFPVALSR
jgi:hypothetical protein